MILHCQQNSHCSAWSWSSPSPPTPLSKSLQVCPGTQGGYHAPNRWDIVIPPIRSVTLLRGTVIHHGAGGPGRALFILFPPTGYRSRMLTVEPESVTDLMNSVPVMPPELLAERAAVGSPLGTEDSLNFRPLDQGSEESAPAEAVPATDPVPAPQEESMADGPADGEPVPPRQSAAQETDPVPAPQKEDMPEAPADAEERPAAPADADAASPPQSAPEEDVLTPDAIPKPVCFVSQAAQPLDLPVPYMGDILLLQEGMCAGLFLNSTDHAHAGPTGGRATACLTPHIHQWCPPPPTEATDRCRVRCTAGTVVYSFAALGAAFVREPGAACMAWMAMAHFTQPVSPQDAEMLGLLRVHKARRAICSCAENVCPRGALHAHDFVTRHTSHVAFGVHQIPDWRGNFAVGSRKFPSWRAPTHRLARAK